MRSSFNQLLVALSVIDSLYVITGIVDYSLVKVPMVKLILAMNISILTTFSPKNEKQYEIPMVLYHRYHHFNTIII